MNGIHLSVGSVHLSIGGVVALVAILGLIAVALVPSHGLAMTQHPTSTATLVARPSPTVSPTVLPSVTSTPRPSNTPSPTVTMTATLVPTSTSSPTPTPTVTPSPTMTPTATSTAAPTQTPVPALVCADARRIVQVHHRTLFDLLNVATSGVSFTCGDPTLDAQRPVSASWDYAGTHHLATWTVSRDGEVIAANGTAQTFEKAGSLGDLFRALRD